MNNINNKEDLKKILIQLVDDLYKSKKNDDYLNLNENNSTGGYDEIVVEPEPGTRIKMNSSAFFQRMYNDVNNLKKDTETLLGLYLENIQPTLKSVDENVKQLSNKFQNVENDISKLKQNKPISFNEWLENKSKFAENFAIVIKFFFWIILIFWVLSTGLPDLIGRFLK